MQGERTRTFAVSQGLRQGDAMSTILSTVALEKVMRKVEANSPGGTSCNLLIQKLAIADDINLISRRRQDLEYNLMTLDEEMGLRIKN